MRQVGLAAGLVAVIIALLWAGLSHCPYTTYGDSAVALRDMQQIHAGYFRHNIKALIARVKEQGTPLHQSLIVEGGFPTLLAIVKPLGVRPIFLVNGIVVPLMLVTFGTLVWLLDLDRRRGLLAALLTGLLILLSPSLTKNVMELCRLVRDAPAHTLAFSGFLAMAVADRTTRQTGWVVGGTLLGLSAWTRLPNGAFLVPAIFFAVSHPQMDLRTRAKSALALALGFAIGLLPLLGQTVLEGISPLAIGQADQLVLQTDVIQRTINQELRRGLHPLNFRHMFLPATRTALNQLPLGLQLVLPLALATGFYRWRRITLVFGSITLTFLALYGCYDKVVARYLAVAVLPLTAVLGIFFARLFDSLSRAWAKGVSQDRFYAVSFTSLFLVLTALLLRQANGHWRENRRVWQDAQRFRAWCATLSPGTRVLSNDQTLSSWLGLFSDGRLHRVRWAWPFGGRLRPLLSKSEPPPHLFALFSTPKGAEPASWWAEDLQNLFDLTPAVRVTNLPALGKDLLVRQIMPRPQERELPLMPSANRLFLLARELSVTGRWQKVIATHPDWAEPLAFELQAGPNVLELPAGPISPTPLRLRSEAPLPSFLICQPLDEIAITLDFNSYQHFPVLSHCVQGTTLRWRGYRLWERDWGGSGNPGHRSTPLFFVRNGTVLRLPRATKPLIVRFTLESGDDQPADLERLMRDIRCRLGKVELIPEKEFQPVRELQQPSKIEYRLRTTYTIRPPTGSSEADLELIIPATEDHLVLLTEMSFASPSDENRGEM